MGTPHTLEVWALPKLINPSRYTGKMSSEAMIQGMVPGLRLNYRGSLDGRELRMHSQGLQTERVNDTGYSQTKISTLPCFTADS